VNSLRDLIDNAFNATRQRDRIDAIRMARVATVRVLVRERLEELKQQVVVPPCGAMSSTAFDNLRPITDSIQVITLESAEDRLAFTTVEFRSFATIPDPIIEERRFLRRLLRLLNKIITIALRREAFDRALQRMVLRQRSFFITHGNHPPRLSLRHRTMPGGCAA
jgi:hypothetical protein